MEMEPCDLVRACDVHTLHFVAVTSIMLGHYGPREAGAELELEKELLWKKICPIAH